MTGPEHYREAEHLARALPSCMCETAGCIHEQMQLDRAQVHAALALAAATALSGVILTLPQDSALAVRWNDAIGATP